LRGEDRGEGESISSSPLRGEERGEGESIFLLSLDGRGLR